MIPHTKTKKAQGDHVTPTHAIFQRLSVACKTKFAFFSKSYCDSLSLLALCSSHVPYTLATPSQLPFTKHVMSFILRFVVFSSAWNTLQNLSAENSSSSIYSSVQQEDNSVYFRGLS